MLFLGGLSDIFSRLFGGDPNRQDENGVTRLQHAILKGDSRAALRLIERGADINLRGGLMYPPLHLALERDRQDIALLLMKAGADLNLPDVAGRQPLHIAAKQGQDAMIDHLIRLGAGVHARNQLGQTPLHMAAPIKMDVIQGLIAAGADVNAQDNLGQTPLHVFLYHPQVVPVLLSAGANPNIAAQDGASPFRILLDKPEPALFQDTLRLMLRHGADLNTVNRNGSTAAHVFIENGLWNLYQQAEAASDLSARDARGNTLLHDAVHTPGYELAQAFCCRLLDRAPALLNEKNDAGRTPLGDVVEYAHRLASATREDRVFALSRVLIERGADPSTHDHVGRNLVHYAVKKKHAQMLDLLIASRADLNARDADGISPILLAVQARDVDMVDRLLDAGADPDQTDDAGWTLLDRLAQAGDRDSPVVQRLIVGGGAYKKQLPLQPNLMRPRNINKGKLPGFL